MTKCANCDKDFEPWIRLENPKTEFEWSETESDFCSEECIKDWRDDNKLELCN